MGCFVYWLANKTRLERKRLKQGKLHLGRRLLNSVYESIRDSETELLIVGPEHRYLEPQS